MHIGLSERTIDLHDTAPAWQISLNLVLFWQISGCPHFLSLSGAHAAFASRYMAEPIRADK